MSKKIYVFLERNLGNGYETAYPDIPSWLRRYYCFIIGNPKDTLSKRFNHLIFHREEIDQECPDPRSQGRSPMIVVNAIFPRRFNERHLFSKAGNELLDKCWKNAMAIRQKGSNRTLIIDIPESWYTK